MTLIWTAHSSGKSVGDCGYAISPAGTWKVSPSAICEVIKTLELWWPDDDRYLENADSVHDSLQNALAINKLYTARYSI